MLDAGAADLIAFGKPFISNPDLVERLKKGAPLNYMRSFGVGLISATAVFSLSASPGNASCGQAESI